MAKFTCFKCGGSGEVSFKHIENGVCFTCGGSGKLSYQPKAKTFVEPHPELVIPEAERSTEKQWNYLDKLCGTDRECCRVLAEAGAPYATGRYVSKKTMSKAIEIAKKRAA